MTCRLFLTVATLLVLATPAVGLAQEAGAKSAPAETADRIVLAQQVAAIGRREHDPWIMLGAATLIATPGHPPALETLLGQARAFAWGNQNLEPAIAGVRARAAAPAAAQ